MTTDEKPASPTWALVQRESLVLARSGHMVMVLVGLMALLMLTAAAILPFVLLQGGSTGQFATTLFRLQFRYLYFAALFVVPVVASSTMVTEYKNDCFPMLYTTLIRPGWILWGKVVSVVGLFGMLYIGCLPVSGLAFFYAGTETVSLFQGAVVLFSLALATGSVGLLMSMRTHNHYRAMYRTGAGILGLIIVLPVTLGVVRLMSVPGWADVVLGYLVDDTAYRTVLSGIPDWRPVFVFAAYQGAIAVICLFVAWRRVLPNQSEFGLAAMGWLVWIPGLGRRRKLRRPIADSLNPIAVRDAWLNPLSNGVVQLGLCIGGLVVGVLMASILVEGATEVDPATGFMILSSFRYPFFLVLPPIVAMAMASERENNTLDALRMSLLNYKDVLRGKIMGVWRILTPLIGATFAGQLAGVVAWKLLGSGTGLLVPLTLMVVGGFALVVTVHAIIIFSILGAQSRGTIAGAILLSYLSVFGLWIAASLASSFAFGIVMIGASFARSTGYLGFLHEVFFYTVLVGLMLLMRQAVAQGTYRLMAFG